MCYPLKIKSIIIIIIRCIIDLSSLMVMMPDLESSILGSRPGQDTGLEVFICRSIFPPTTHHSNDWSDPTVFNNMTCNYLLAFACHLRCCLCPRKFHTAYILSLNMPSSRSSW